MTQSTNGIVLRSIKYGETSLIATILTQKFGVQAYIVNGVRSAKKTGAKAALLQPATLLQMHVYHQEQKAIHRIKEMERSFLYRQIQTDVIKNSVALLMAELLLKSLKQPEENDDLFLFCEDAFIQLDAAPPAVTANFPLFFALQLPQFLGFKIPAATAAILNSKEFFWDIQEGTFLQSPPPHGNYLNHADAISIATLLQAMQPPELAQIKLAHQNRRFLLDRLLDYYAIHIADFGQLKTLKVLQEVLS